VPSRVLPTGRIRGRIQNELFSEGRPLPEILEEVAWLAQLLMQAALEADVTESCPATALPAGRGR
jgi:hypothetical protein